MGVDDRLQRRLHAALQHQHLARLSCDVQVGQHDVLGRRVVPALGRGGLVVPDVFARVRIERDDEIVLELVVDRGELVPDPLVQLRAGMDAVALAVALQKVLEARQR